MSTSRSQLGLNEGPADSIAAGLTMRKFLVFLQSESIPKYDFFVLYEAGYVPRWCSEPTGFDEAYCDVLVCDYDNAPDASRQACRRMKTGDHDAAVIYFSAGSLNTEEPEPDLVLQSGLNESDFIAKLDQLRAGRC
jgi:hypothetical protein